VGGLAHVSSDRIERKEDRLTSSQVVTVKEVMIGAHVLLEKLVEVDVGRLLANGDGGRRSGRSIERDVLLWLDPRVERAHVGAGGGGSTHQSLLRSPSSDRVGAGLLGTAETAGTWLTKRRHSATALVGRQVRHSETIVRDPAVHVHAAEVEGALETWVQTLTSRVIHAAVLIGTTVVAVVVATCITTREAAVDIGVGWNRHLIARVVGAVAEGLSKAVAIASDRDFAVSRDQGNRGAWSASFLSQSDGKVLSSRSAWVGACKWLLGFILDCSSRVLIRSLVKASL
jgi:hypothetical protein